MKQKIYIDTSIVGGFFDKEFDCVEMKNTIQAKIYAETKDMNFKELRAYMDKVLQKDSFWNRINHSGVGI